ncbi:MAG: hypothetical protein HFJ34_02570 [Clostridia bacterium]|nr:hypothetical protein [Clostridia bacterium]
MDEKSSDNKRQFWKNATPKEQEENFGVFITLIEELKNEDYQLVKLFSETDKTVLKKYHIELLELMKQNKENFIIVENIWKNLNSNFQKENSNILKDTIKQLMIQNEDISKIWKVTNGEVQSDMLDELLEKCDDLEKSMEILKGLKVLLPKEKWQVFLEKNEVSTDLIESSYKLYQTIFKMNKDVHETINLKMFDDKILQTFNLEKMARLTTYPKMQERIVSLSKIKGFDAVFKSINDDNWVMELDGVLKNVENYPELLKHIANEKIDEKSAQMLVQVFSQKENYFNISTVLEARNYFERREDICQKILNNEEIENLNPILKNYSDEDRKRFAVLEMMYGIDINEAKNLVEKYGKGIEKMDANQYDKSAIALLGIKRILECENIGAKYEENKTIFDNAREEIQYTNIADLEANCLNMYAKMYQQTLYQPQKDDKVEEVEYEETKIEVYEVQDDFNMFIRAEGACNGYEEPKDFAENLGMPSTRYHGNCKSFIGQDSISIANSNGVKFGYSNCKDGTLLMASPWDIMSNAANAEFSTASEKWNINCGIQLRTPKEMINHTRHGYNEFDFEKLIYNEQEQKFEGDKPQYIIYVKEPNIERQEDDKWRVSKKAAKQMNLPIVMIDREKCVKRDWEKLVALQNILLGKSENKDNISESDLIESIILKFENNVNSVRASKVLASKYFTMEQRRTITTNIVKYIKSLENVDFNRYQKLFNTYREVVQNETDKTISNTGIQVSEDRYGQSYLEALNKKCIQIENQRSKRFLVDKYQEVGIRQTDIIDAKIFLEVTKNKEQEKEEQIRGIS